MKIPRLLANGDGPAVRPTEHLTRKLSGFQGHFCVAILALLWLNACAVHPAERDNEGVRIAAVGGEMGQMQSQQIVQNLCRQSDYPALARMVSEISALSELPLYIDNQVELLIDGPETYCSMRRAIEAAEHYILLETYIFADDPEGLNFAELLSEKSAAGVVVKVIYDSIGSFGSGAGFFKRMESSGIELLEFNAANPLRGGNPFKLNNRGHRKILVVDGLVAFTGGINLSSTYSQSSDNCQKLNPKREGWRDTHVMIRGPAVTGFKAKFQENWKALAGDIPLPAVPEESIEMPDREIVAILSAHGGNHVESAIIAAYLDAIRMAHERIWITQAYFVPDKQFMNLVTQAATRGVDVRILVPGLLDSSIVLNASRSRYSDLLRAGVRLWEAQHALLHAKTAVIDSVWSTVGSSNLDYRSFLHNDELNAFVLGPEFGSQMEAQFERDIAAAQEITYAVWKKRPLCARIREKFSWLFKYWL